MPIWAYVKANSMFPHVPPETRRHGSDASFPSWEAFTRRKKEGPQNSLREILHAWCAASADFTDVADILKSGTQSPQVQRSSHSRQVVKGFVYLMRYGSSGKVYKIGVAENVPRRHAQIRMMAPQDLRIVHSIPSDDPYGIEQYWHTRFAEKIVEGKKELFHLSAVDVAAFKSRKYQ